MSVDDLSMAQLRRLAEKELNVPATLHDYQWEGVGFLYRASGALLADEMGLGKTVQTVVALALLLHRQESVQRALIVAPAALTFNWMKEISTWAPSITARCLSGDAPEREAYYLLPIPVLVASYEQIRLDAFDRVPAGTFDLIILDEAQRIKNPASATSLACRLLPRSRAWALTATPLENDEEDVSSILRFLDPSVGRRLSRSYVSTQLLNLMLRRRKVDVRAELPPVLIQDLRIELSASQRASYDELWFSRIDAIRRGSGENLSTALLALLTRLKILCNFDLDSGSSSKFEVLESLIEGAGQGARILVFSQFVETLVQISKRLSLPSDLLTGSMSMEARHEAMTSFMQSPSPRVLLVSLRAGGVGLNLGGTSHVVLYDRWWNPAVEVQAIYRAHRFERDLPLHVVRFLVTDTIEERVAQTLERKRILFADVIESVKTTHHRFTREEMMEVLELDVGDFSRLLAERNETQTDGEDLRIP